MAIRYSVKSFLLVVAFVALGITSLVSANPLWASVNCTLVLLAVLLAVVAACASRAEGRAFWLGFAIMAGGWLYLVEFDSKGLRGGLWEPLLITNRLMATAYELVDTYVVELRDNDRNLPAVARMSTGVKRIYRSEQDFILTGNCLFALALGYLGGLWGVRCYRKWAPRSEA